MSFARTKRLLIALLAQVTLCLSLAPVVAAQVPTQKEGSKGSESPSGDGLTILAARDAANGRPEDVSETEQSQIRRVGRVSARLSSPKSTRRFGRAEDKRRVETRPTAECASDAFSPSPGTPGEGWGGGKSSAEFKVLSAEHSALSLSTQHSNLSTSDRTPTLTLPRSTGGGNIVAVLLACAEAHPTARLSIGDSVQPTGPPAK